MPTNESIGMSRVLDRIRSATNTLRATLHSRMSRLGAEAASGDRKRPRVLYFILRYPSFSETYMHEEIRSLRDQYEIEVITLQPADNFRREAFPYHLIRYLDDCLVYSPIGKLNLEFTNPAQQDFLRKVDALIERFKPDVLHAHYFGLGLLLEHLAQRHGIPFTLRTHSMDLLSEPPRRIATLTRSANSAWCERVLVFPPLRDALVQGGIAPDRAVECWPVINFSRFHKPGRRERTRRVLCAGPAIRKKSHEDFIELAQRMRGSGIGFDLYAKGPLLGQTRRYNEAAGSPVRITYADPDDMAEVYPRYDWLVYPSNTRINKVGLPAAIPEAQASGIGVCWQELPGRREAQLDFLGGGGVLFRDIGEVPAIISEACPEEMRLRAIENARKCDIEQHKDLLSSAWESARARRSATAGSAKAAPAS